MKGLLRGTRRGRAEGPIESARERSGRAGPISAREEGHFAERGVAARAFHRRHSFSSALSLQSPAFSCVTKLNSGHAQADGHAGMTSCCPAWMRPVNQAVRSWLDQLRRRAGRPGRNHHAELFAAHARHRMSLVRTLFFTSTPTRRSTVVARQGGQWVVVHLLEAIDVEQHDGGAVAVALAAGELRSRWLLERSACCAPG